MDKAMLGGGCSFETDALGNAQIQALDPTDFSDEDTAEVSLLTAFDNCVIGKLVCDENRREELTNVLLKSGAVLK